MNGFEWFLLMEEDPDALSDTMTPNEREHGPVVAVEMAAFGDWYRYEDGYEEFRSIGD